MRVVVEGRIWTDLRLKSLEKIVLENEIHPYDAGKYCAMGMLIYLWHSAQLKLKTELLAEEIDECLHPGATHMLIATGFLKEVEPGGVYRVAGVWRRIQKLQTMMMNYSRAGKLSARKRWGTPLPSDYENDKEK